MRISFLPLAGSVLFFLFSCQKMQDPVFNRISNVNVGKLGLATSEMTFDVEYYNPNKKGGKLKEAQGEAWIDSSYLGHFIVDTLIDIPRHANFVLPVKLSMDMKYFLKLSMSGFKNEEVLVTIKGNARVGRSGVYKKFPINYQAKHNLAQLLKQGSN